MNAAPLAEVIRSGVSPAGAETQSADFARLETVDKEMRQPRFPSLPGTIEGAIPSASPSAALQDETQLQWPELPGLESSAPIHAALSIMAREATDPLIWPRLRGLRIDAFEPRLSQSGHRNKVDAEQRGARWNG
jgi:hypothetical protein